VALWAHYSGRPREPIAWRTGSLPLPTKSPETTIVLHFDPTSLWPQPIELEITIRRTRPAFVHSPQDYTTIGTSQLRLKLSASRAFGEGEWLREEFPLPANFDLKKLAPAYVSPFTLNHLDWSLVLLPQRPGQPVVERPWHEILPPAVAELVGTASSVDHPAFARPRRLLREGSGLPGMQYELRESLWLFIPAILLAGILLRHCRVAGPVLLAVAVTALLTAIAADARRIRAERAVAENPDFPAYQRALARALSYISYFR
jgi:hypothetical protein